MWWKHVKSGCTNRKEKNLRWIFSQHSTGPLYANILQWVFPAESLLVCDFLTVAR